MSLYNILHSLFLASHLGMQIGKAHNPYLRVNPISYEIEKFFCYMKDMKLIIVILPNHTDAIYGE